ncbi:hypothetical protein JZO82_03825 [Vagococcus fluvialis]|uniref:hypothetical protein n=1 Tax=Vagococcus fluvialis TaxID=2738 RepID=UPI001A8D3DC5|nr:hypothetical protein [Vagococcus fluvialis]MBO0428286.1 hypothetical protein [Vagococcus fluvialis]
MKKKWLIGIGLLSLILILVTVSNLLFQTKLEKLSEVDKEMVQDLNTLNTKLKDEELWPGFNLDEYPLIMINRTGVLNTYYAVNFKNTNKIGAKNINLELLDETNLTLSRYNFLYPSVIPLNFSFGNFSTTGSNRIIDQNKPVFYLKYDKTNFEKYPPSNQLIIFLAHEAFHYYHQTNWTDGNPNIDTLNKEYLSLIGLSYKILDDLNQPNLSTKETLELLQKYTVVSKEKENLNKDYFQDESKKEMIESTASYVGRKAGKLVGKEYNILEFENGGNPKFYEVFTTMSQGEFGTDFITDFSLYNTGNVLANSLDQIDSELWKKELNNQTKEQPIFFSDLIDLYLENNPVQKVDLNQIKSEYDYSDIVNTSEKFDFSK